MNTTESLRQRTSHHPALHLVQVELYHLEESRELIPTGLHQRWS